MKATKRTGLERAERQILLGVPVLFAAGAAFHFLYGLSGGALLVGLLAPVNESVWEHLKLALWPQTLWWTAGYVLCARRQAADAAAWCAAALGALVATGCAMLLLFYFYTGAFGVELLWADIALFFLAVLLGQWAGLRLYQRGSGVSALVPLALLAALLVVFAVFTLVPPDLPLFTDAVTGARGVSPL